MVVVGTGWVMFDCSCCNGRMSSCPLQSGTTAVGSAAAANCSQHIGECSVSNHFHSLPLSPRGLELSDTHAVLFSPAAMILLEWFTFSPQFWRHLTLLNVTAE